ncbi:hypothetical protein RchiOBHm_Chr1g0331651 [Rosa chinensis]|uniref:Uncharacterized protein n=1 Tax=Rosa chinensis TaxID=74649 RepID=A0A2P6SBL9_ROSCH|nr:hypothetical protein RchiOBHm_Chr1g0331651 [Rosa chinensis]
MAKKKAAVIEEENAMCICYYMKNAYSNVTYLTEHNQGVKDRSV